MLLGREFILKIVQEVINLEQRTSVAIARLSTGLV